MSTKSPKMSKAAIKGVKVKKHAKFDLSVSKPEQVREIVDALKSLQQDRGWLLLKQIFEGNIAVLEGAILKKISPDDGKSALSEEECDRLRDRLGYLEELISKPEAIIARYTQKQPETPNYDPYHTVPIRGDGKG